MKFIPVLFQHGLNVVCDTWRLVELAIVYFCQLFNSGYSQHGETAKSDKSFRDEHLIKVLNKVFLTPTEMTQFESLKKTPHFGSGQSDWSFRWGRFIKLLIQAQFLFYVAPTLVGVKLILSFGIRFRQNGNGHS